VRQARFPSAVRTSGCMEYLGDPRNVACGVSTGNGSYATSRSGQRGTMTDGVNRRPLSPRLEGNQQRTTLGRVCSMTEPHVRCVGMSRS
jgi:hypothetical protein